ncbi:hypothetical protein BX589_12130 [Paraburkholderia fungorum]|nr:hypothetical protein BX589_12130 [Paraburkholderia fungorum]
MTSTWPPVSRGVYDPVERLYGSGRTVLDGAGDQPASQKR